MAPRQPSCPGPDRRSFLRVGGLALGGLTLPGLLRARASGLAARGKAVIQVVLSGGPSQAETYDPKPDAPSCYRTDVGVIPTALPGVVVSELLPRQARILDRMALVRSLAHETSDHLAGLHGIMTGYPATQRPDRAERPSLGSIVAELEPAIPGRALPPYIALGTADGPGRLFRDGAYLGPAASPFAVEVGADGGVAVAHLEPPPGVSPERLADRRRLLARIDRLDRAIDRSGGMAGLDRFAAEAWAMTTGPEARRALDLGRESAAARDRYGRTRVGQSCLLARRLVEAGVAAVTIVEGDWDHHGQVSARCRRAVPPVDLAVASLVEDLGARGMLDDVLVVVWGEFGRTPKVNGAGGRDHWPGSMSVALAGGGLRMGQVIGATDATGGQPVDAPVRPEDVVRTIYHALRIDPLATFPDESGRPRAILDRGRPIAALVA